MIYTRRSTLSDALAVIPAQAGIQFFERRDLDEHWSPAFAGVTELETLSFVASSATLL
jgi:hypothetical protein